MNEIATLEFTITGPSSAENLDRPSSVTARFAAVQRSSAISTVSESPAQGFIAWLSGWLFL